MKFLEQEITLGDKTITLLRFLLFIGSALGLAVSLWLQFIKIYDMSDAQNTSRDVPYGIWPGWISGRLQDLTDEQWTNWRDTLPTLVVSMSLFLSASYYSRYLQDKCGWSKQTQLHFYCIVGFVTSFMLHGLDFLLPLTFIAINYFITKAIRHIPESRANAVIWAYNGACLVAIHVLDIPSLVPYLKWIPFFGEYEGFARWNVYYKLSMLRQISFGIDYQQSIRKRGTAPLSTSSSDRPDTRQSVAEAEKYTFVALYAYTTYLPLYIAGPIATFSSFIHNCEVKQTNVPFKSIMIMFAQVICYTIALDIWLHYIYIYSWNTLGRWDQYTPGFLSMICFWTLHHMFLKFTIIWRCFRAFALLDGVNVTENMQKCISNTNSFQGFWRAWHASFSEWLVKYIYVPLGGRQRRVLGLWLIFFFVGAWHEFDAKWMAFSMFNATGITIESVIRHWVYSSGQTKLDISRTSWPIRCLEVFVGAVNVALLTLSNFAINQGFQRMSSFFYYAYLQNTEAVLNFFLSIGYLVLVVIQFYANPWNSANAENMPSKPGTKAL